MPPDKIMHNKLAPFWAMLFVLLGTVGLATVWFNLGAFWNGYVLDITGPAWNYILFRGLFTEYHDNAWTRFFTPMRTVVLFIVFCFGIETIQYLKIYDSIFDPWDLLAYFSILVPIFIVDVWLAKK